MKTFKTEKGTELPLMDIKGKPYLQVAHRLVWFNEKYPLWSIETELKPYETYTDARAIIRDETGRIRSTGHKRETQQGFPDHYEKAETGAIGRALVFIGIGTQFVEELDEGTRLADAPTIPAKKYFDNIAERAIEKKKAESEIEPPSNDGPPPGWDNELSEALHDAQPGSYVVLFGRNKDKQICDIPVEFLRKDVEWWRGKEANGERLGPKAIAFVEAAEQYLKIKE